MTTLKRPVVPSRRSGGDRTRGNHQVSHERATPATFSENSTVWAEKPVQNLPVPRGFASPLERFLGASG